MAREKILKEDFSSAKYGFPKGITITGENADIVFPLFLGDEDNYIELVAYEKQDNLLVLTYAYSSCGKKVEIPERGKMLYSLIMAYLRSEEGGWFGKIKRKITNISWLGKIARGKGSSLRWYIMDYKYDSSLADYRKWYDTKGKEYKKL